MTAGPPEIILASGSPRRRELLDRMGIKFEVVVADVDEVTWPQLPLHTALHNAAIKARAVYKKLGDERPILAADTVVFLGDRLFGKPPCLEAAQDYLTALSGQTHEVITGCKLFDPEDEPDYCWESFFARSRVTFRTLTPELVEKYLAAVHVLDKAGAYALQEHGDWIIERVEGSRDNVLGLPTELLSRVLARHGLL